ncbi:MAG: rhodanese-like domain-containing protein [Fidelibacterota bacterium]
MMKKMILLVFALSVAVPLDAFQTKPAEEDKTVYGNITAAELEKRLGNEEELVLLDVRTPEEFSGPLGHLEGAILIPVQELEQRVDELKEVKGREIIVYCRSGNRSRVASEILVRHGFMATNLLGGMKAWNAMNAASIKEQNDSVSVKESTQQKSGKAVKVD